MGLRRWLGLRTPKAATVKNQKSDIHTLLWQRARESAAEFIETNLSESMIFRDENGIRRYAMDSAPKAGLLLEFGVFQGQSINAFANQLNENRDERVIYGFDSFEGLSEDWAGHHLTAGHFDQKGTLPSVKRNVRLIKGWIDETLPPFLSDTAEEIAFLHVDTDTYSPAKTILELCRPRLFPGSIILFDELLAYPGWRNGEFKALTQTIPENNYKWRAFGSFCAMLEITRKLNA